MIQLNDEERELLSKVLETSLDVGRRGNPRLRPLSMYSSELKNLLQVAGALELAARGQPPHATLRTADRYRNTLRNMGLWDRSDATFVQNDATQAILDLQATGDNSPDFWRENSREGDRIPFRRQVTRLLDSEENLVPTLWREVFFNVQELVDHSDRQILDAALQDYPQLTEIEAIQYMNAVGTEPWRYSRLGPEDRQAVQQLMIRIRRDWNNEHPTSDNPIEQAAIQYGQAINAYQRDVRIRVAGFVGSYLEMKDEMGSEFPRIAPDGTVTLQLSRIGRAGEVRDASAALNEAGDAPAEPLNLPRQLIISGCPGSGKSHLAERSVGAETELIRTQFHAETSTASFVGSYRPVPVYEPMNGLQDLAGAPFDRGRPMIDYRFVPGPALRAISTARRRPERNVVLLIEELNRGNAAAAFGELFQLLDRADDGWSKYSVTLPAEAEAWLIEQGALQAGANLRLPPNLYIWATMNSGDQGVFPIDTAFRRRWAYRYLGYAQPCDYPEASRQLRFGGVEVDWDILRNGINRKLKQLRINEDRLIGPYFLTREQLASPAEVLSKLLLYLWDDVLRFRQEELFRHESFADVTSAWAMGAGNPFVDGVVELPPVAAARTNTNDGSNEPVMHTEQDPDAGRDAAA